jgi:hypothetical protein
MDCTVKTTEKLWLFVRNNCIFYIILSKLFVIGPLFYAGDTLIKKSNFPHL